MIKTIGKRLLPLLLAVLLLFSTIPMQAFATEDDSINDYESFVFNLMLLERFAELYVEQNPGKDPLDLVIKYIRTGVDRYNSGSWNIMAGYEDAGFAEFVSMMELYANSEATSEEEMIHVTNMKNINNFVLPNGNKADLGHVFGTMDITYHNKSSENHADVGGWAGDLVDLLELSDTKGVSGTLEEMIATISKNYLGADLSPLPGFSLQDIYGDLDAYYIMQSLSNTEYSFGVLYGIFTQYFTSDLNAEARADFFLKNRLGTTGTRAQIRDAVYNAYTTNKVINTLEGTREFKSSDLATLRKACCYAFADYLCELAGDYVADTTNPYFDVFSSETSTLAPGVTQEIKYATSADNKQMVYYLATADITRDDVNLYANYNNNDPAAGWAMSRVIDQANAAQEKYGNPESEHYIENYNVVASTNGAGFNMQTGEPSGLLVMNGVEYQKINSSGFFGILKDGTPVIGTTEEYNTIYKDKVQEGIASFSYTLIKDGKIVISETDYFGNRASRTAVGITKTGKVVLMVLDGRQEPFSCGGSMIEIAQIMLDAGCVEAVNLDGGGSTTFVAKQVGDDELSVVNRPSDGFSRSVSTSLMVVSTAPSSTKFDHAVLETDYNYMTIGSTLKINPIALSATGNSTELPEGTYWEVSDSRWATITEDGTLTAHRNGTVDVYLMLDGTIVGNKTITIVSPTNVYYTKTIIDAIYGSKVTLPVVSLYENKPVKTNENDLVFTLSSPTAGTITNGVFVGNEASGIKVVTINVALANNTSISANATVNLYNQGEATFDFDQATGGDRQLAWDRQVSNATSDDAVNYTIINSDEDMVTSYIVALDMTEIPIPEVLSDLVYMLPGADVEGANAWSFLCQLAQRVSTLTEVKAVLDFDDRFDVDYSNLKILNEYFTFKESTFDEETNSLSIILKWKKQTQAIDMATANPICIVSGIKLTPKADADWGDKNRIAAVNTGNISYMVYLRASALYSFSQKPENQATYGLFPYENPEDESDKGGGFGQTYKEFYDTYTLINSLKNGWFHENGGFSYYVDGEKYTGIHEIDGYYYDFGTDGINVGQTPYNGLFFDETAGVYRYAKLGVLTTGWNMINGEWHYFHASTGAAATGRTRVSGIYYTFETNGKLTTGVWIHTLKGVRYYYGPSYHTTRWQLIDGDWYYFRNGYLVLGYAEVVNRENAAIREWHDFGKDGKDRGLVPDGMVQQGDKNYYIKDGKAVVGLCKVDEDYYFFNYSGKIAKNQKTYVWATHCDLPCGNYEFGPDGKMLQGIVEKNGTLYYYENGVTGTHGLINYNGDYYYVYWGGVVKTGKQYVSRTACDLPVGNYEFGADGKMLQGVVEKDGALYYYKNGVTGTCGLINYNGDYYYVYWGGVVKTGKQYVSRTACDLPVGNYEFGADGKMLQGIVEKNGTLYYYENGVTGTCGLINYNGDYYYVYWGGVVKTGKQYVSRTACDLPVGNYEFGADGKMLQGVVEKNGTLYYYENGVTGTCGLINYNGDYYYVYWGGVVKTGKQYVSRTACDLPVGNYEFGADGKMLQGVVEKDGALYYYKNGVTGTYGMVEIDGDYYLVNWGGTIAKGKYYVSKSYCDLPVGNYEFGADGKMLDGLVEKDGVLYYYENGVTGTCGLIEIDGDYYYVYWGGIIKTGKQYVSRTNCDLPIGNYEFGADGKMLDGFVTKEDGIYYYNKGKADALGLIYIDGYFYFVNYNGKLITNQKFYVYKTNDLMIETTYTFNELGQIIG